MLVNKKYKAISSPIHCFKWKGINRKGIKIKGEYQASTRVEIKAELRRQGVHVTQIKKKMKPLFSFQNIIRPVDIMLISRQTATMLNAGLPLLQTLQLIAKSCKKLPLKRLLIDIAHEIESGTSLSTALRRYPRYFDKLYCELVSAGEQSGSLDVIYNRIASYKEKSEILKSKIKKAMFYPIAVIVVANIVMMLLLCFVIPQFKEIFDSFGAELPPFTQLVLAISAFVEASWYIFLIGGVLILFSFKKLYRDHLRLRDLCDKFTLKIPMIGRLMTKAAVARFARTLSTTFSAGIPLVDGLVSASGASGNVVYRDAIENIRAEVMSGIEVHAAMKLTGVFPEMVSQMVMIGEASGDLDGMLSKIADIYEQQVNDSVDALTSLLEPAIMVVLGILVGGLIIAMYWPIFKLGTVMG